MAAALGVVAIVLGPATWSGVTTWEGANNVLPAGGPGGGFAGFGPLPTDPADGSADDRQPRRLSGANGFDFFGGADPKLVAFLRANRGDARFLLATANASTAAPYILETGEPVAALGGFLGSDPILTDAELAAAVGDGDIRYVLGPSRAQSERMQSLIGPAMAAFGGNLGWVNDHCVEIPVTEWRSDPDSDTAMFADMQTLFDCAGRRPPIGT